MRSDLAVRVCTNQPVNLTGEERVWVVKTSIRCYYIINSLHNPTFEGQACLHRGLNATEINYFPCQSLLSRFPMTEKKGVGV